MRCRIWLTPLVFIVFFPGSGVAFGQSVGPDEAADARGTLAPTPALTATQKSAIYNAVLQQRVRASTTAIQTNIGAPVPPSVTLSDLPGQDDTDDPTLLKYAMVEGDVVVVDPVRMRVVDIIRGGTRR
jgi:Protein of unknown function (DUF1236)